MSSTPIGIFDSGVGGLTIMREIMHQLPHESVIYLADTANLPYGEKEADAIIRYSLECGRFLLQHNIKLLVVACNTAAAYSLDILRKQLPIPVIGVIEPTAQEAVRTTRNQRLALLATLATVRSKIYADYIKALLPKAEVISVACPLFVPLIEGGFSSQSAQPIVKEYLKNLHSEKIDTVVLGCTHYPFLSDIIQQEMGPQVSLITSGESCARQIALTLKTLHLQAPSSQRSLYRFFVSNNPEKFQRFANNYFNIQ